MEKSYRIESETALETVLKMANELSWDEFESFVDELKNRYTEGVLGQLSLIAEHLATRAAEVGEYLEQRGGGGSGDRPHDTAMKAVQRTRKRIRRALGFTFP